MIADTTFLIELHREQSTGHEGSASAFLSRFRANPIRITIISAGEFAAGFSELRAARDFLGRFPMMRLTPETAYEASRIDRELMVDGLRLGENDNWIAGILDKSPESVLSKK